ncbi:hypothetical protein AYO44_13745 [Planctomycetaceae bacterium SCGC AG-212-F19]|nr:hypothetical protein AYO44_13745 [Planctomycetaceae bacterium SCGC AG-212-F19]
MSDAASFDFLAPAQSADELGRLGTYRVLKVLGHGGMGVVFQAEDSHLKRVVAVKAMLPEVAKKATARERFLREARAAAALEHDHIVPIYHVSEERGVPYLVMPMLKGASLEDWLKKKGSSLTVGQILKLGREIAKGLAAAHEVGLIHRDIKPANIWLDATTGGRVKILDFGLARPAETDAQITQSGIIVGTPAYMAPEQATGQKIDGRADLFSLGVVLYRLCSGRLPWKGETAMATLMAVATEEATPLDQLKPELPPALTDLVMKLLAKKPDDRPKSAKAVVEAIVAIEKSLAADKVKVAAPLAAAGTPWQQLDERSETAPLVKAPVRKRSRRWPLLAAALMLLGGGMLLWQVIIRIENKDGSKTEIKLPPGATVTVEKDGKTVAQVPDGAGQRAAAQLPATGELDLLKLIDPQKHAVLGQWRFDGSVLVSPLSDPAILVIPHNPPQEYELEIKAKKLDNDSFQVGLVAADSQFRAVFDAWPGHGVLSGLENINGKGVRDNGVSHVGSVFPRNQVVTILCSVRKPGVRLTCDGKTVVDWKGDFKSLSLGGPFNDYPQLKNKLFLASWRTGFHIQKLVLRPLGDAQPSGSGVDEAWIKTVQAMPPAKQAEAVAAKLKELNPGFDGKVTHKVANGVVTELKISTINVADISPVRALSGLSVLAAHGDFFQKNGKLASMAPLAGLKLQVLDVWDNPTLNDLSPVRGMPLNRVSIQETAVADLSPLRGAPLQQLYINDTPVRDLAPVRGMPLWGLHMAQTQIADLGPLEGMKLTVFWCYGSPVSDLSPLRGMSLEDLMFTPQTITKGMEIVREMKSLKGIGTKGWGQDKVPAQQFWKEYDAKSAAFEQWIKDTQKLPAEKQVEAVAAKLKELNPGFDGKERHKIDEGAVTFFHIDTHNVTDISPIRALSKLKTLTIEDTWPARGKLADLSPLRGMELTHLYAHHNLYSDLSPLQGMRLVVFRCSATGVADLSPLKGMPLVYLECYGTEVADLSPLKGMPLGHLNIDGLNHVRDLSALQGMPLKLLQCGGIPVTDFSALKNLPLKEIKGSFQPERDAEILRSIKTLEKINGKSAAEFWKEVDAKKP